MIWFLGARSALSDSRRGKDGFLDSDQCLNNVAIKRKKIIGFLNALYTKKF